MSAATSVAYPFDGDRLNPSPRAVAAGTPWDEPSPIQDAAETRPKERRVARLDIRMLDAWRGLAALVVVVMHVFVAAIYGPYPELANRWFYGIMGFGNYGVQIFFVISGLCVAQAAIRALKGERTVYAFITARARRIYPPYLAASLLAILASFVGAELVRYHLLPGSSLGAARLFDRSTVDYLCSLTLTQHSCGTEPLLPVFWTLCYEAAFYLIVAALMTVAAAFRRPLLVLDISHCLSVACALVAILDPTLLPFPLNLWPEFGLGVVVLDILSFRRTTAWLTGLVVMSLQLAFAAGHLGHAAGYVPTSGMQAAVAAAFALVLVLVNPLDGVIARIAPVRLLSWVGVFSYSLYLTHWIVIAPVAQALKALGAVSADTYWFSGVCQVAAAILGASLFYQAVEKPFLSRRRLVADRRATLLSNS